jgi:hypothetical protein
MKITQRCIQKFLVLRDFFHLKTYHLEQVFVAIILIITALITQRGLVEWVGVIAVFLNFGHVTVAERLREAEAMRHARNEPVVVDCYKKLDYYYFGKELFWLVYFIMLGAWSALVGIGIFLLYRPWREMYRKYHK